MQDHSHLMQFLHMVGFWLLWYRFRFTSTRALGQSSFLLFPFSFRSFLSPHLGRTSNRCRFSVLTAVGAMLPPTPPSNIFPCRTACILRMFLYLCRQVNAACRL